MTIPSPPDTRIRVLIVDGARSGTLRRAFERLGHEPLLAERGDSLEQLSADVEAVIIGGPREDALALCRRVKTRYQVPLLPVAVLLPRPVRLPEEPYAPDAWLPPGTRGRDVVARIEELVRIRRAESELVRLNRALTELAAENGRLYERARREAEATTVLLRELQHRVRNNLAAIQALLVLERHRDPPRALSDALDVAIGRLRSMAALQDALSPSTSALSLHALAEGVARGVFDVFGASSSVQCSVSGDATVSARCASSVAIVLNELVTNALKHSGSTEVRIQIDERADGLRVIVEDDGAGMPEAAPTGSGLTIARAVVRNELGGALSFEAKERGTRIFVDVPSERAHESAAPRERSLQRA